MGRPMSELEAMMTQALGRAEDRNAALRRELAEVKDRAEKAEKERDNATETAIDLIMNYCEKHRISGMSFMDWHDATDASECRMCIVEQRDAARAEAGRLRP